MTAAGGRRAPGLGRFRRLGTAERTLVANSGSIIVAVVILSTATAFPLWGGAVAVAVAMHGG